MARILRAIGLDVWGHGPHCEDYDCPGDCDGWTVNDRSACGSIEIADDATDLDTLRALQSAGILGSTLGPDDLTFDWVDESFCSIELSEDGRPLLHLESDPG